LWTTSAVVSRKPTASTAERPQLVGERVFTEVSVAGAPAVSFCVDPGAGDPVAAWFLLHDWIDEPVQRAFLALVAPEMRVLDLGCHLGTFSLPAARLGASVLAVDANSTHVELLNAAAARNGFDRLAAVQRAMSDAEAPVAFVERSIHGHVGLGDEERNGPGVAYVAPATVDGLLAERGWDGVELIKMDIEGMETVALAGMRELFASGARPQIVFECNATTLPRFGSSICELREQLAALDYELLLIDHLRPGVLVEYGPLAVQPESVCDYLALPARPPTLRRDWRIERPFSREQLMTRLLDTAAGDGGGYRAYAAAVLAHGPQWLHASDDAAAALAALHSDAEAVVREAFQPARGAALREHADAPEPRQEGRPPDVVVWARQLCVRRRSDELERSLDDDRGDRGELLLEHANLHVRSGQLVAIVSEREQTASALLRVLAGEEPPADGTVERSEQAMLLAEVGRGFEPDLTVSENIALYAAFLGCAVNEAEQRAERVAEIAGLGPEQLAFRLEQLDAAAIAGLALSVALELTTPRLLLVDRVPPIAAGSLRDWLTARTWQLRLAGGAIIQVIDEESALLGPANRVVWITGSRVACEGHPQSVFEARRRALLGLPVTTPRRGLS
jgi:lipopolysaccharide transport system ATP-binding protein